MVKPTRDEKKAVTRERILDAAGEVFVQRGYLATSLEQVADRAGLTKGAVYSNFDSKDHLFVEAVMRRAGAVASAEALPTSDVSLPDAVRRLITAGIKAAQKRHRDAAVLEFELGLVALRNPNVRRMLSDHHRQAYETLGTFLELKAADDGIELGCSGRDLAVMLTTATRGLLQQWLMDPRLVPMDLVDRTVTRLLRGEE